MRRQRSPRKRTGRRAGETGLEANPSPGEKAAAPAAGRDGFRAVDGRYRIVFENVSEGILVAQDGMLRMVNPAIVRFTGRSEKELLSRPFTEFLHPDDRERVLQYHRARLQGTDAPGIYEFRLLNRDGTIRWIEIRAVLITWEGRPASVNFLFDVTDRHEVEEDLRRSEDRFRIAATCASDLIYEWEIPTGRLRWFGDIDGALGEKRGAFPRTIEAWSERIHPEDRPRVEEALRLHVEEEGPFAQEYRMRRASGSWLVWNDRGTTVRDEAGKPLRMIGACTDVTERRRAEEETRRERDRAEQYLDVAAVMLLALDGEGNIALMNRRGYEILGYDTDLTGRNWFDTALPPRIVPSVRSIFAKIMSGDLKAVERVQGEVLTRSGEVRIIDWRNTVVRDAAGKIVGTLSSGEDVTEQRRAQEEVRRLMTLIDHANFGVAIVDLDGSLLYLNESFAASHGYEARELLGMNLRVLHGQEQLPRVEELTARLRESGEYFLEEVGHLHRDGHAFPMLMNGVLIRDEEGKPAFLGATAIDMTGQKDLEERLRHAQKMEAIGTLAGGIAHDFNNILYSMLGFADLAMDDTEQGSRSFRCLEQVRGAGLRGAELVNRILAFSRRTARETREFRLQPAVDESTRLLEAARPSNVKIRVALDLACGRVLGDPTEIHQIVMNLGANAFHAMRGRAGVVSIALSEREIGEEEASRNPDLRPGRYASLSVEDAGHGMDEKTLKRIFEPFFTTKPVGEGTGLGLATVHGIVRGMQGTILVTSAPGRGTRFEVLLPLVGDGPGADGGVADDSRERTENGIPQS